MMSGDVSVELVGAATDEVRSLIEALEAELTLNYPAEQRHGLSLEAIFRPEIRFFVARMAGAAVGCGGVGLYEGFGELKRMYVRPGWRGTGVAVALVRRLEAETRGAGLGMLRLETGTAQHAAMRMYAREGFVMCGAFGRYAGMAASQVAGSVFMEKRLP